MDVLTVVFAFGVAVAVVGCTWAVVCWGFTPRFSIPRTGSGFMASILSVVAESPAGRWSVAAGGIAGLLLLWGTGGEVAGVLGGAVAGGVCYYLWHKSVEDRRTEERRRDIFVLFDALEIYLRAGYSMQYALSVSRSLVSSIRPAINKALSYWPAGAESALKVLRDEINLPEGDVLVSLLAQIERAGIDRLEGVLAREVARMEEVRQAAAKMRIMSRPLYLVIYRALPLLAVQGMVAGTMAMRAFEVLRQTGILP